MRKFFFTAGIVSIALASCGTVQSIVQNTFPYTTNVLISTGVPANQEVSSSAIASNVQSWVGGNTNAQIKNIRISDAKISSISGSDLSALKSVKIYISSSGAGEKLVASRNDISTNANSATLDLADSSYLDEIVKSSDLKVRTFYVLKNQVSMDTNMRVSLNFSSVPVTNN